MRDDGQQSRALFPVMPDSSDNEFIRDVLKGLHSIPKYLPSEYLPTANEPLNILKTDVRIPDMLELEIIQAERAKIAHLLSDKGAFKLVDFTSYEMPKTDLLIETLISEGIKFEYVPIGSTTYNLENIIGQLWTKYPNINIFPLLGDRFDILEDLKSENSRKVVNCIEVTSFFPDFESSVLFIQRLSDCLNPGDMAIMSFDIKKSPQSVMSYHNLHPKRSMEYYKEYLERINQTLSGNFNFRKFIRQAFYDPESGIYKSFLLSLTSCKVDFNLVDEHIMLREWETILFETFKVFDEEEISFLEICGGFTAKDVYYDKKHLQLIVIWQKNC